MAEEENVGPIEDSSWVRVRDKDIFSRRVTGRPSDEGARSVRNKQGRDFLSRTRRLEEFYIFQFEVVTVVNDDIFYLKAQECKDRNIAGLHFQLQINL